ncbi:hypothetical protein FVE67_07175 [Thermosulfurimonas marina]|uniref:PD-(D/E)XK endonuclease-like domain-containing protein n=1 Tax=Thermosulfurimonas marina TaxID=2047767 RepID=A0A6H1WTW3_9BACT|nr:PD-(D/E)XK nuclease family protein [Thermosulfurimonas marina]QJA06589.1 hypothetical protein FVE67_07175 [Thermosulfurimonas marina]
MKIRLRQLRRPLRLLGERDRETLLGELAHLTLYFLKDPRDLEGPLSRALALYPEPFPEREALRSRLREVLSRALSHPRMAEYFSSEGEDLREREFLKKGKKGLESLRPDRILLKKDEVLVLEYKLHRPKEKRLYEDYQKQLKEYLEGLREVFPGRVRGVLVFLEPPEVEEVSP